MPSLPQPCWMGHRALWAAASALQPEWQPLPPPWLAGHRSSPGWCQVSHVIGNTPVSLAARHQLTAWVYCAQPLQPLLRKQLTATLLPIEAHRSFTGSEHFIAFCLHACADCVLDRLF